jgi:phospholipase/carboxylesterase
VEFIHQFVPGRLPVTVLLLHGSGGDENDLLPVGRGVAPGAALLSPRGKNFDHAEARFFKLDAGDVRERAAELVEWLEQAAVSYKFDPQRVYALGYSNGANMAAAAMLLHPGAIAAACLLRSKLVITPDRLPDLGGAPVLISAGQRDEIIPLPGAEALGKLLTSAGAHVNLAVQNAGHELTPADFSLAKQWFANESFRGGKVFR